MNERLKVPAIPQKFLDVLGDFREILRLTPTIRGANVRRLVESTSFDMSQYAHGQITIHNYRDTTTSQFQDNGIFIGDCIECAVQQFRAFELQNPGLYHSIKPAIFFTANERGWNHFLFGVLADADVDGVRGVAFDNAHQNNFLLVHSNGSNLLIPNYDYQIVEVFDNPNTNWMLQPDDTYSYNPERPGWDIRKQSFSSTMGTLKHFGLSDSNSQVLLRVQRQQPYVDIVIAETQESITTAFPESELAKLVQKLLDSIANSE